MFSCSMEVFTHCLQPKRVYNRYTHTYEYASCGKCYACLNRKASIKTARVSNEIKSHRYSLFFTLTYDNDSVPRFEIFKDSKGVNQIRPVGRLVDSYKSFPLHYSRKYAAYGLPVLLDDDYFTIEKDDVLNEFAVCSKYDIQCFIKRLRRFVDKYNPNLDKNERKFRYYIASEYGPETFRPHYHGELFFDRPELLGTLEAGIVSCWGLSERVDGARNRFVFRPFASPALTRGYIKLSDANTAYYIADYISGNASLPPSLQSSLTRPFSLCSQSPIVGAYKADGTQMLHDVSRGTVEHGVQRVDKGDGSVSIVTVPYTESDLCSVFRKCRGFRALPAYAKSLVYSFAHEHRLEWEDYARPYLTHFGCSDFRHLSRVCPELSFRSYMERTYPDMYAALEMDCDTNWYASVYASNMIKKYPIFRNSGYASPVDCYLHLFEESIRLSQLYRLGKFYDNCNEWYASFGPSSVFAAYPRLAEYVPTYKHDLVNIPLQYKSVILDLGLSDVLYRNGFLDSDYLSSCVESSSYLFVDFFLDEYSKFERRDKSKKANNKYLHGHRKMD